VILTVKPAPTHTLAPAPDTSRLTDEIDKLRSQLATAQARATKAEQRSLELATEMSVVERKAINQSERMTLMVEAEHKAKVRAGVGGW